MYTYYGKTVSEMARDRGLNQSTLYNRLSRGLTWKKALSPYMNPNRAKDGLKRCAKCKTVLPIKRFNNNSKAHDGLTSYCKACANASVKESRSNIGTERNQAQRKRYAANLAKVRPYYRFADNSVYKHKAKGQELPLTALELEELASETTHCALCGKKIDWSDKLGPNSGTVDRVDNESIMVLAEDAWIVHRHCNASKGKKTAVDYLGGLPGSEKLAQIDLPDNNNIVHIGGTY